MLQEKMFRVNLVAVSPIHIGCDDAYEPTSFKIDEKKKELLHFNPLDFVRLLSAEQKKNFFDLCSKGTVQSLLDVFKFIGGTQISGNHMSRVELSSGFLEHYRSIKQLTKQNMNQEMKKFVINRTAYNPNSQQPYIPGTSLKGSLRTAYLNSLADEIQLREKEKRGKTLEALLLVGSRACRPEADPFRHLHVSDLRPTGHVSRKIMYAVNKKRKESKHEASGPFQILETIQPGSELEGTIKFSSLPAGKQEFPVEPSRLADAIQKFYVSLFEEDLKTLNAIRATTDAIREQVERHKTNEGKLYLVRIGRHSGAEAVTIRGHRDIKIMQKKGEKPKFDDHTTTLWLASGEKEPKENTKLLPFGWAVLKFARPG